MKNVYENQSGMLFHAEGKPFGHLIHFNGHGVFDPDHGKVDVDPELVDAHNKILDEAYLKGLDENCEIGQGGFFYHKEDADEGHLVTTFTGVVVTKDVRVEGKTITFRRNQREYRGRLRAESENFNFKRVA